MCRHSSCRLSAVVACDVMVAGQVGPRRVGIAVICCYMLANRMVSDRISSDIVESDLLLSVCLLSHQDMSARLNTGLDCGICSADFLDQCDHPGT